MKELGVGFCLSKQLTFNIFVHQERLRMQLSFNLFFSGASSGLMAPAPAPVPAPAPAQAGPRGAQALSMHGRVQHDRSGGPAPVRYVNFLACEGYTVEIIGGKHFKTPEGEFVEMKSGTQYKIHVKNTRAYGKQ